MHFHGFNFEGWNEQPIANKSTNQYMILSQWATAHFPLLAPPAGDELSGWVSSLYATRPGVHAESLDVSTFQ